MAVGFFTLCIDPNSFLVDTSSRIGITLAGIFAAGLCIRAFVCVPVCRYGTFAAAFRKGTQAPVNKVS